VLIIQQEHGAADLPLSVTEGPSADDLAVLSSVLDEVAPTPPPLRGRRDARDPLVSMRRLPALSSRPTALSFDALCQDMASLSLARSTSKALDLVESMLAQQMGVDAARMDGRTLMHWGAERGNIQVVKLLLSRNGLPGPVDKDGRTPIHLAAAQGHLAAVELLEPTRFCSPFVA
jgi:ankyrin repeat protein